MSPKQKSGKCDYWVAHWAEYWQGLTVVGDTKCSRSIPYLVALRFTRFSLLCHLGIQRRILARTFNGEELGIKRQYIPSSGRYVIARVPFIVKAVTTYLPHAWMKTLILIVVQRSRWDSPPRGPCESKQSQYPEIAPRHRCHYRAYLWRDGTCWRGCPSRTGSLTSSLYALRLWNKSKSPRSCWYNLRMVILTLGRTGRILFFRQFTLEAPPKTLRT